MRPQEADAVAVVQALRASFVEGRTRPLSWRLRQLRALEELLAREAGRLEQALEADLGRSPVESFLAELVGARGEVQALRRGLPRWSRDERARVPLVLRPGRARILRQPLGVVLVVAPWNYPVNLVLAPLAAALAAGNCVVVKPSEQAAACSALLAELLPRYLDRGAVSVLEGDSRVTEALIDAGVDHVFFTGSPAVGRLVMARAAAQLTPVTLELGGKSPVVVAADADLAVAARRIAWGKFLNAGQSCIAPDYVLVEAACADRLVVALGDAVRQMYGQDPATSPDYGRVVNDRHLVRLGRLLEGHGGEVVLGGQLETSSCYLAPTIVRQPSLDAALMQEEIFGPVLPVLAVEDLEEAARLVAARPPPLALYVFTSNRDAAARLVGATRSGGVCINSTMHQFAASTLPFGGVGESGTGRYHGRFGYEALSQLRPVLEKGVRADLRLVYPPYRPLEARLLRAVLGRGCLRWCAGARRPPGGRPSGALGRGGARGLL